MNLGKEAYDRLVVGKSMWPQKDEDKFASLGSKLMHTPCFMS